MILKKLFLTLTCCTAFLYSQGQNPLSKSDFWSKVRYGGGLGLNFTNGGFNIAVAPSAVYDFNQWFSLGTGLNFSYSKFNEDKFIAYGGSVLSLFNPIPQIQLAAEFEQIRVNRTLTAVPNPIEDNYWAPALFASIGYRTRNVTFGLRYDLLYNKNRSIYSNDLMPFVRVFF